MNSKNKIHLAVIFTLAAILVFTGCRGPTAEPTPTPFIEKEEGEADPFIGVPNPASFYCQEMGYQLELRDTDQGTEGVCVFPDGKECDEWDFLAGRCAIEWSFCQRQGYNLREGEESAICEFPDGSSCPEYEFFIEECQPPE